MPVRRESIRRAAACAWTIGWPVRSREIGCASHGARERGRGSARKAGVGGAFMKRFGGV